MWIKYVNDLADKYFRSNAAVEKKHQKKREKNHKSSPQNGTSSPHGGSMNDSNGEDYLPPIPKDASNNHA